MGVFRLQVALLAVLWMIVTGASAQSALAQDGVWLQIEARSSEDAATERARDYAGRLPNVAGFRLPSGWYAIALGPYPPDAAQAELARLRAEGQVPRDSFIADGSGYSEQFWPFGAGIVTATPAAVPDQRQNGPADETPAEARAAERLLTREEREEIQRALETLGYYRSRIDGAFGPGTRRAMADWQAAFGHEPTGILTTGQRRELVGGLRQALNSLGMELVNDARAGIEIALPLAKLSFAGYEAPFARYDGAEVRVLLISQTGDAKTLQGLYDVMQSLEIVPLDGPREFLGDSFTLTGVNDRIASYTYAVLRDGAVKGFTLVWPVGDELRRSLALDRMLASFRTFPDAILPDTAGDLAVQRPDLLAGLQIRQPDASVSGFFVDGRGMTVTVSGAVTDCSRVTLGGEVDADIAATDRTLGMALLTPRAPLAPLGIGQLSERTPRLQSEVAVAGYSYGGILGAPTISFGTLEELRGLQGEQNLARLAMRVEPGDAGGPVLDATGGVLGMLLPANEEGRRTLPDDVHFAAGAEALAAFLAENGINLTPAGNEDDLAPEDLALIGADMTVLVECWN